jgi:HK97 family phage prohead protease
MEQGKKEIRTLPFVELRVGEDGDENFIEGHAAVFDSWSETLGGIFPFKEKVRKGAFVDSLGQDDIRALFNHDPNYVLGRNKAGTLHLTEDERGLLVKISPPNTTWAKDLRTSIERGDINQMSIGFVVEDDEWRYEDGYDVRELKKVKLYDVSPVTFPAYTATDVGVRAMESYNEYRAKQAEEQTTADKLAVEAKAKQKLQSLINKFKNI